jgi:hypothetical protein
MPNVTINSPLTKNDVLANFFVSVTWSAAKLKGSSTLRCTVDGNAGNPSDVVVTAATGTQLFSFTNVHEGDREVYATLSETSGIVADDSETVHVTARAISFDQPNAFNDLGTSNARFLLSGSYPEPARVSHLTLHAYKVDAVHADVDRRRNGVTRSAPVKKFVVSGSEYLYYPTALGGQWVVLVDSRIEIPSDGYQLRVTTYGAQGQALVTTSGPVPSAMVKRSKRPQTAEIKKA